MSSVFKRKLPQFLSDYKRERDANTDAVPSDVKQSNLDATERIGRETANFTEWASSFGDDNKVISRKTEELAKKSEKLKLLENQLLELVKLNTDLNVKIEAVKNKTEVIKEEIPQLENSVTDLEKNVLLLEEDVRQKKETVKTCFKSLRKITNIYEKYCGCKVRVESPEIVVFEFSSDFYVKLYSKDMKKNWMVMDMRPEINERENLEKKLLETDNVQGLLACLYNAFSSHLV